MFLFIVVVTIIAAFLLTLVILAQNPKGGGLSSQFGGSGASQMMGVKRTTDILEKTTWALSIIIVGLCLTSFVFLPKQNVEEGLSTPAMERASEQSVIPSEFDDSNPLGGSNSQDSSAQIEIEGLTDPE